MVASEIEQNGARRTIGWMALLTALASALGACIAPLFEGVRWHEASLPCLAAGTVFIAMTRWSVRRIESEPSSAVRVMMAGIGVHFGVVVGGGLALILAGGFEPVATFVSLLAAFAIGQPLGTAALRRAVFASSRSGSGGGTAGATSSRNLIAEVSA